MPKNRFIVVFSIKMPWVLLQSRTHVVFLERDGLILDSHFELPEIELARDNCASMCACNALHSKYHSLDLSCTGICF